MNGETHTHVHVRVINNDVILCAIILLSRHYTASDLYRTVHNAYDILYYDFYAMWTCVRVCGYHIYAYTHCTHYTHRSIRADGEWYWPRDHAISSARHSAGTPTDGAAAAINQTRLRRYWKVIGGRARAKVPGSRVQRALDAASRRQIFVARARRRARPTLYEPRLHATRSRRPGPIGPCDCV